MKTVHPTIIFLRTKTFHVFLMANESSQKGGEESLDSFPENCFKIYYFSAQSVFRTIDIQAWIKTAKSGTYLLFVAIWKLTWSLILNVTFPSTSSLLNGRKKHSPLFSYVIRPWASPTNTSLVTVPITLSSRSTCNKHRN